MQTKSRLAVALAALILVATFHLPLWSIGLTAPQYTEGLGMYIGLDDIWGHDRHDIANINILNHYIGMRPIVPDEVGVLKIMPWAVGFLIVTGLVVAAVGRRWLLAAWLGVFALLGAAGMWEFYSWKYEYGHNLDPRAPIKVPGMTYQPPLIGTKTLLNITATSYPSWGTLLVMLSFGLGLGALIYDVRRKGGRLAGALRRTGAGAAQSVGRLAAGTTGILLATAALGGATILIAACGPGEAGSAPAAEPVTALAGQACAFCDGVVPDERFGAELVLRSGETFRFMSTECLAGFIASRRLADRDVRSIRVVDYNDGRKLIDARTAHYVRTPNRPSPNGLNLLATETEKVAWNLHFFFHGERLSWSEVLELVRSEWRL